MDLIAGVVGSAVAIYAAIGLFFLTVRLRRAADEEYGVFAVLCAALALLSAARVAEAHATNAPDLLSASRFACVALIASTVLLVHFALDYTHLPSRRAWLVFAYSSGAAYELLNARGLLHDVNALTAEPSVAHAQMSGLGVHRCTRPESRQPRPARSRSSPGRTFAEGGKRSRS